MMTLPPTSSSIVGVDLKPAQNNAQHHTDELSNQLLIVRRGQSFILDVQLNLSYNGDVLSLLFTVTMGEQANEESGTKCVFGIPDTVTRPVGATTIWSAIVDHKKSYPEMGSLTLIITPPANAPVGKYSLHLSHAGEEDDLGSLVLLFNPWCIDDWVYMPEEADRQEYVMNQHGVIYKGSGNYIFSMDWDFGQFEEKMVEICLTLLDLSKEHMDNPAEGTAAHCNPIVVSRMVSAMINSKDDRGVLKGNWSGNFVGGVAPSHWSGSYPILQRWLTIDCNPVKYGQCWVFAGVMCSVMRLLGIPCRVVTNFQSAHDRDINLIVDVYHADYGVREIPSEDSVWNYHVWVEGWMKRPDLPSGFDGWQVLDPTPQERSDGIYCCGPASVTAILNGNTDMPFDVPFVFAEVNADCIDWLVMADGTKKEIYSDKKRVGHNISTKSVASDKRWNITRNYKHTEGSEKERSVFKYAITRDYTRPSDSEESDSEDDDEEPANTGDNSGSTENSTTNVNGESTGEGGVSRPNTGDNNGSTENSTSTISGETPRGRVTEPNTGDNEGPTENSSSSVNRETPGGGVTEPNTGDNEGPTDNSSSSVNGETPRGGVTGPWPNEMGNLGSNIFETETTVTRTSQPPPPITMKIKEVSKPMNGEDVQMKLVLRSDASVPRPLSINISVTAMSYNGTPLAPIRSELKKEMLLPGKPLRVPVVVAWSEYCKPMLDSEVMKISAVVSDTSSPDQVYLVENDVVLLDPPLNIELLNEARVWREAVVEVAFANPVDQTLEKCSLTLSGSGLWTDEQVISLPDIVPNSRVRVKVAFTPYKIGAHTLVADFDCSVFRDIKRSLSIPVKHSMSTPYASFFNSRI